MGSSTRISFGIHKAKLQRGYSLDLSSEQGKEKSETLPEQPFSWGHSQNFSQATFSSSDQKYKEKNDDVFMPA